MILRRLWRFACYRRSPDGLTHEQRSAYRQLSQLVNAYGLPEDSVILADFEQFAQDIERDCLGSRQRRTRS